MSRTDLRFGVPADLLLGTRFRDNVPQADQMRQRAEVEEILRRLAHQPGVILADEVGMGKTFVALGVAYSVARQNPLGPVVVMVPPNLIDKWEQDLKTFCELYLESRVPLRLDLAPRQQLVARTALRYGIARHSVELLRLLDDASRERAHLVFLAQGAMTRRQSDKWVRLAIIAEALRTHGRGGARRLIQVKAQIHRFLARLLWAIGDERAHDEGEIVWQRLLQSDTTRWKEIYNSAAGEGRRLMDDPVPKVIARALHKVDLRQLADALQEMPVRARGGDARVKERVNAARRVLAGVESELWTRLLAQARWRSPLLVMDEAHHLKNPHAKLARQLQSHDTDADLKTGDGAMAGAFERMLFLTATPFQLGHHELVRVLERFGDIRWNPEELGDHERFRQRMTELHASLNESQRSAIALQRSWGRLRPEDCDEDVDAWWSRIQTCPGEQLSTRQRAVVDAYDAARRTREAAEHALRPWLVRHNKGTHWVGTSIARRQRLDGARISDMNVVTGIPIPPRQLLPFFLAARSVVSGGQDLLGEALSSSYEAFRFTRQNQRAAKDDEGDPDPPIVSLSNAGWYLGEFDRALEKTRGATHPKIAATVKRAVDLWEKGEKVLVFAFYRHTCHALRVHISDEIERRLASHTKPSIETVQRRFFDDADYRGRRALDEELERVLLSRDGALNRTQVPERQREEIVTIMRRFLRVGTTLVRCFPIADVDHLDPAEVAQRALDTPDGSSTTWRQKFQSFIDFLVRCSTEERRLFLEASIRTETGRIRVEDDEEEDGDGDSRASRLTLANVQVATGKTKRDARARLMRAFNTPFFPDILVCSEVMGEGVDLQRFCRHVIHHDLAWNPSTIEQRTGRIDRLGCKAEGRHPIVVYVPYLAGTADERQYRVMSHREQWFRVVMGQEEVAKLITPESQTGVQLPEAVSAGLTFKLQLEGWD